MREIQQRVAWLMVVIVLGLGFMTLQLYKLTVLEAGQWVSQAEVNMLRELPLHAARGMIYDRNGRPLAISEPAFAAMLINPNASAVERFLPNLALVLAEGNRQRADEMAARIWRSVQEREAWGLSYQPMVLAHKISLETVATLVERRLEFPGVIIVQDSSRSYPQGQVAAQVLGYVGLISGAELEDHEFNPDDSYGMSEIVGKVGLERFYESVLRGRHGVQQAMVNYAGRPVDDSSREIPPQPGHNLYLTLDIELQRVSEEVLKRQIEWIRQQNDPHANPTRGTLVVQHVKTGAILAMASVPGYDPNWFVDGLTIAQADLLFNSSDGRLLNWGITPVEPGSTYKMGVGLAGLQAGVLGRYETVPCTPLYARDPNFVNWTTFNEGRLDIAQALARSCNPYFYEVGHHLGIDRLAEFLDQFGFGKQTGIDLPGEPAGILPTREIYGENWHPGQVYNVSIGQGYVNVSPLQLVNYTAAIAMNGERYRPYLVQEIRDSEGNLVSRTEPELLTVVDALTENWRRLQEGMRLTVTSPTGTASLPLQGFPIPVAAKTGSAEIGPNRPDRALTVAYAPYDDPEIAIAVYIEGGAKGSWVTPVARRVFAAYFGIADTGEKQNTYKD